MRGKQSLQHAQCLGECVARRQRILGNVATGRHTIDTTGTVGAGLYQLHIVVTEPPKERLRTLQRSGIVELIKGGGGISDHTRQPREHGLVDRHADSTGFVATEGEHEFGDVQQFVGELATNFHLVFTECGVNTRASRSRPVTHCVAAVLIEQVDGCHHVAFRFRHFLAVRVENPPGQCGALPRDSAMGKVRTHHGGKQPRANDVVALWSHVHREDPREQIVTIHPVRSNLWRER